MTNIREKENREDEIVYLKKKLHTKDIGKSYEKNSKIIEQIICNKNPLFDKTGIVTRKYR